MEAKVVRLRRTGPRQDCFDFVPRFFGADVSIINDLLLIELSNHIRRGMPLYAAYAALGSVLGCVLLYFIARKAAKRYFTEKAGKHATPFRHGWSRTDSWDSNRSAFAAADTFQNIVCLPRGV